MKFSLKHLIIFVTFTAVLCGVSGYFYTQVRVAHLRAQEAVEVAMTERDRAMQAEKLAREATTSNGFQTVQSRKVDCHLTALNPKLEPIGQVSGLVNLFEHEYDGFTFWHGMAEVTGSVEELKEWFGLGQDNDIKIRVELESGETGLAKLVVLRLNEDDTPFDTVTIGLVGTNLLTKDAGN
jgi:hypothetical protein